ncbi:ankyrin repeat-containing protein [Cucumis melo var. makuwa]|nr:ankyrin repeat-containing protein [Cucumis melo var. makuwa]
MTFQGGVNPPGGIWQQDTSFNYSNFTDSSNYEWFKRLSLYGYLTDNDNIDNTATLLFPAGTGVMAYQQPQLYWVYLWVNTISFLASVSVILMIVGRFPLKNRISSWILALAMCIAVVSLAIGYLIGVKMVNLMAITEYIKFNDYDNVLPSSVLCWLAVVGMVGLWQVAHFLKSLFYIFISKLKPHSASRVNSGTSLFSHTT